MSGLWLHWAVSSHLFLAAALSRASGHNHAQPGAPWLSFALDFGERFCQYRISSINHSLFYRAASWTGAFALIVPGVYLSSIHFMNSEWLSRAGCLIVMIGLWSGIGGIFQERLLTSRIRWRRRNAIVSARARLAEEQADSERMKKELKEIDETFDKESAKATHNLRLSIGVLEVSLLMTGTFLWGFGDLLVR